MPHLTRPTMYRLALACALLLLLAVGLYTFRQGAFVRACNPALVEAEATVLVADEVRAKFGIQRESNQEPIEVAPGQLVEVIVVLAPQPAGCADAFGVDWELSFVVFAPHEVRTIRDRPLAERVEIVLGEQRPNPQGEDHIVVVVRDAAGQALRVGIIRLKGARA